MKKTLVLFALLSVVATFAFAQDFSKDPAVGVWMSIDDDGKTPTGYWELYLKNGKLFGRMIYAIGESVDAKLSDLKTTPYEGHPLQTNLSVKPVIGTDLMWNMENKAPGQWVKGRIIDPKNGKMYYVKVVNNGNTLKMTGSLDKAGVLGRSQIWKKSSMERALAAKAALE